MSDAPYQKQAVDGRSSKPIHRDLKISSFDLGMSGTDNTPIRIMSVILIVAGAIFGLIFAFEIATLGRKAGVTTSGHGQIYWGFIYVCLVAAFVLVIYFGVQLPRFGVLVSSQYFIIRGLRARKIELEYVTAVDVGEDRFLGRWVIAPILELRDGQRVPIVQLSFRNAPLARRNPIERLLPLAEVLRKRVGVTGVEMAMPHFITGV